MTTTAKHGEADWLPALKKLFRKYKERKHPLESENAYQLIVKVVLSSQTTDDLINGLAPKLFEKYPSFEALAGAKPEDLYPFIGSVRSCMKKAAWLVAIAKTVAGEKKFPLTMDRLTSLKGIGRKSANVIMSGAGVEMEGVIVDLHVLRVAPRLGIAKGTDPEKIEKQLMEKVPREYWRQLGMGLTILGRELCRPTDPACPKCPVNQACQYYRH
ncbi:MAG TPA: endonuclease III [Bacteroidota bacterium]|jgi:endonuclease-3|nr:endonuclease III [Bacteroidota bacterium]